MKTKNKFHLITKKKDKNGDFTYTSPNTNEEMLNLIKNKDLLQKEYDNCLKNCIEDINKFKKENEGNKLFINKLSFLETQIKNHLFNIKYYGYVNEEKDESDESSSSSSEKEGEEEGKE